jgi:hypothetical protein
MLNSSEGLAPYTIDASEARLEREIDELTITTKSLAYINSKLITVKNQAAQINELSRVSKIEDTESNLVYKRVYDRIQGIE